MGGVLSRGLNFLGWISVLTRGGSGALLRLWLFASAVGNGCDLMHLDGTGSRVASDSEVRGGLGFQM